MTAVLVTPTAKWWQSIVREPAAFLALVTAGLTLLVAFHVHLSTGEQVAIGGFFTAALLVLRQITTPANEVIAQQKPGEPVKATAKAARAWGLAKDTVVHVTKAKAA